VPWNVVKLKTAPDQTITLKSPREITIMRDSGRLVAEIVQHLKDVTRPGMSTADVDKIAAEHMRRHGATSTAYGYYGYPGYICVSVNDEVVHGIPGPKKIRHGDLVKVDVAASYKGYVGDTTISFSVGPAGPDAARLMRVTEDALLKGIEQAWPGNRIGDISHAIQRHVEASGLSIVREFVGHGVGRSMHEAPQVPHFGPPGKGRLLVPGMVLAIEPQVNLGLPGVRVLEDGWTSVTLDGSLSAHFEHTVAITDEGPRILTLL
jgi:methionyl aminopeptidase